jgi:signal peptidase I
MNKKTSLQKRISRLIRNWAVPVGCGLLFLFLLKFVLFFGYVPSVSMEPTIRSGSFIFGVRILGELKRGDVVIFEHCGMILVKRIIALPGDTVYIDEAGSVFINAVTTDPSFMQLVPEEKYFVLGDNIEYSTDSRYWSDPFIMRSQIIAHQ